MIINNIEYCVAIFKMNEEEFPEWIVDFNDFYEFNEYVKEHKEDKEYKENVIAYSFCELIDGEADSFSWTQIIPFEVMSDEQIQYEIDYFIESEKENKEYWAKFEEKSKEINYRGISEDYTSKKEHLKDITYVCPRCLHEVHECKCMFYPFYLVQIDTEMLPIIRELNSKGYITKGCCAGHLHRLDDFTIYIAFDKEYDFDTEFPEGGKYSKSRHTISYRIPENCDDIEYYRFRILDELLEWAELLDDLTLEYETELDMLEYDE